jgi:hypothetical protein
MYMVVTAVLYISLTKYVNKICKSFARYVCVYVCIYRVIKSLCSPDDYSTESYLAQSDCLAADRLGQGDIRLTLTPSVIPNSNYVIMISDSNCLKYFCVFLYCNHQVRRDVLITLYIYSRIVPNFTRNCASVLPTSHLRHIGVLFRHWRNIQMLHPGVHTSQK